MLRSTCVQIQCARSVKTVNMESSPDNIPSPALSPDNDEYSNALSEYDELSLEAAKRFEVFGDADMQFKNLQEELHSLLIRGDSLWDEAMSSVKGSSHHKKTVDELKEVMTGIRKTLSSQSKTLDALDKSVQRAARGLARLSESVTAVVREAAGVRQSLDARIEEMRNANPGRPAKQSASSSSSSKTKTHAPPEDKHHRHKEAPRGHSPQRSRSSERVARA